jgi:hypothetical protein
MVDDRRLEENLFTSYGEHFAQQLNLSTEKCIMDNKSSQLTGNHTRKELYERRMSVQAIETLIELRSNGQLCDCVLKLDDGIELPVHKIVLSAASNFFRALFTTGLGNSNERLMEIKDIDSSTMNLIIEWAYTRNVCITSENVESLLYAADRFQILGLLNISAEFLEKYIHLDNIIGICKFSKVFFLPNLRKKAHNFLM